MGAGYKCITDYTDAIDSLLIKHIKLDHKKAYGLVHRMYIDPKTQRNIADIDNDINSGEYAIWDDRFDMIWFHRLIRTRFTPDDSGFGRKSTSNTEEIDAALVCWANRDGHWLGNRVQVKQHNLYDYIMSVIAGVPGVAVQNVNFEHADIEQSEFQENKTSKESILLKIEYRIKVSGRLCTTLPDCSFEPCKLI